MRRQRQKQIRKTLKGQSSSCWCCGGARTGHTRKVSGLERSLCEACLFQAESEVELQGRAMELFSYITWDSFVPNKHRRKVDLLRRHRDSEIIALANELIQEDDFQRKMSSARREREWSTLAQLNERHEDWVANRTERIGEEWSRRFGN